jgi:hypothetical protein
MPNDSVFDSLVDLWREAGLEYHPVIGPSEISTLIPFLLRANNAN